MLLGVEVRLGPGHIVLERDQAPSPKRGQSPQFWAHLYCGQTAGCTKMPLDMEVGLSPGDFVLEGDLATPQKLAEPPQFSAHVYCGQTAEWVTMPLAMEVGHGQTTLC